MQPRLATPADSSALTELTRILDPENVYPVKEFAQLDALNGDGGFCRRWVVESQEEILAHVSLYSGRTSYGAKVARIHIQRRPEILGSEWFREAVHFIEAQSKLFGFKKLFLSHDARRIEDFPVLESESYQSHGTKEKRVFDLTIFDVEKYQSLLDSVLKRGFHYLPKTQWTPAFVEKLYPVFRECEEDVPEPMNVHSYESYLDEINDPKIQERSTVAILDSSDEIAGFGYLIDIPKENEILTANTGVARKFRGKGIAKAIKIWQLLEAKDRGYEKISTWNAAVNLPMIRVNESVGFKKVTGYTMWVKEFA